MTTNNDLRTLLTALPAIRARIEAWQPVLDDWRKCSDEALQGFVNAVSYHDDLRSLLALIDMLVAVNNERLQPSNTLHTRERIYQLIVNLAYQGKPLRFNDIGDNDMGTVMSLITEGRVIRREDERGEPYYVPSAKADDE